MATVADLEAALALANAARPEDDQIVPEGTKKADLAKALADAGVIVEEKPKGDALYVTAPLVSVTTNQGRSVRHLYRGDVLPADVTEESLQNLQDLGYVSTDSPL